MCLDNISITATCNGEPVMIILTEEQKRLLPSFLIGSSDESQAIRVVKLDTEVYRLDTHTILNKSETKEE